MMPKKPQITKSEYKALEFDVIPIEIEEAMEDFERMTVASMRNWEAIKQRAAFFTNTMLMQIQPDEQASTENIYNWMEVLTNRANIMALMIEDTINKHKYDVTMAKLAMKKSPLTKRSKSK